MPDPTIVLSGHTFKADPYPTYAWLREKEPVFCRTSADGQARMWFLLSYADVADALRDHRGFVKDVYTTLTPAARAALPEEPPLYRLLTHHMLNADDPTHARLRALVNKAFTAAMVERLAPRLETLAHALLQRVWTRGHMDLIEDFALPFAIDVIGEMLGMPERDHHRLRAWSKVLVAPSANSERNTAKTARLRQVMQDFVDYLARICAERRRAPRNDLITSLLQAEHAGDHLSQDELYSMVLLIVVVGHETSVYLIANAVYNLLLRPDLVAVLRATPGLLPTAVEELIRYAGPVERATMRFAAHDMSVHNQCIRQGDAVSLVLASAHRDPAAFAQPDQVDLLRTDNRHLGFGLGIHYCLGAPLARLEARVALTALLCHLPGLHLAPTAHTLAWHTNPILHGMKKLPVCWDPA